ncbi:MAG: DUF3817 domain-containing protein [Ferruginibacter sp.]|nr:DUF3817 domain-containing protein [Ferruginibacter sp.]
MDKSIRLLNRFRWVAIIEGISYLILLFIAMPLKYYAGMPEVVLYMGWVHGAFFMLFLALLISVWGDRKWSAAKAFLAFIASLLPFGTIIFDIVVKKELNKLKLSVA